MKNKIGILENDIHLFPIVNSVICEVYSFGMFESETPVKP